MLETVENNFIKSYRVRNSMKALDRVRKELSPPAYRRFKDLLRYRLYGEDFDKEPLDYKIAVAFSMGSDSTATLLILRWAGFNVVPVMVRLPQMSDVVLMRAGEYGAVLVKAPNYMEIMKEQIKKKAPICGRCHSMVMDAVKDYARREGIKIVASGDLLSVGSLSIYKQEDLINLNFPAFLAMDKEETINVLNRKYALGFGCPLWRAASKNAPILKRFGIQRVMRELRAGALNEKFAKKLILDILVQ